MTMVARASMARIARTTPMPTPPTPKADFIARPTGVRRSFVNWPRHHGEPAWAGGGRYRYALQFHRGVPRLGENARSKDGGDDCSEFERHIVSFDLGQWLG
jgi:hypothetical protein